MMVYTSKLTKCLLLLSILDQATSEVHRLHSSTSENGRSHACGSDRITLTCDTTGSRVTWTATSDLVRRIIFIDSDPIWTINDQETIVGILQQNNLQSDGSNIRNFVTELIVYTTPSIREISVTCSSDNESSSHVISPSAFPEPPLFKAEPHLLQTESSTTSDQYYVQWEPPSNIADFDLDHYQLYADDSLIQRVYGDQRYAVIDVQKGVTTTVKIAAADKCRQLSNYRLTTITASSVTTDSDRPQTTAVTFDSSSAASADSQNSYSGSQHNASNLLVIICLALILSTLMLLNT